MTSVSVGQTLWREVGPVCVAYALVGLSFGAITVSAGIPGWVAPLMSATVFAGSAQFAAVGIMLGGGGVLAAMVAGWVINARMLAYGLSIRHTLGRGTWRRLVGAHLITDVNTALVLAEPKADSGSERARAVLGRGIVDLRDLERGRDGRGVGGRWSNRYPRAGPGRRAAGDSS